MRQLRFIPLILGLILAAGIHTTAAGQAIPTPAELIQKMTEAYAKTPVFHAKVHATTTEAHAKVVLFDEGFRERTCKFTIEVAADPKRYDMMTLRDGTQDGKDIPYTLYSRFMWDGMLGLKTGNRSGEPTKVDKGSISFTTNAEAVEREKSSSLNSFFWHKRDVLSFIEILKNADKITLAQAMETVDGAACYHVIADGRYGHDEYWIDPAADYNIRKGLATRKAGDQVRAIGPKGPMDIPLERPADDRSPTVTASRASFDNIKLKNVAGVWLPSHYLIKSEMIYGDGGGKQTSVEVDYTFTPDPNFVLLQAFHWVVPEGMAMVKLDPPAGGKYIYRGGNIVKIADGKSGTGPGEVLLGPPRK